MPQRFLTALPVYNEAAHVAPVLAEVRRYSSDILVVNDGSTDGTADRLAAVDGIQIVTHAKTKAMARRCARPLITPCSTATTCWSRSIAMASINHG